MPGNFFFQVKNKIGVCRPLWNLYNDVAVQGICHSVVGTLVTGFILIYEWFKRVVKEM